jgi:signal peptidase I
VARGRGLRPAVATLAVAAAWLTGCGSDNDTFGVQMPNEAMLPAYAPGDELTVDRTAFEHHPPRVGEVVVFHAPIGAATGKCGVPRRAARPCPRPTATSKNIRLLLRVVAGPGQRVAFRNGVAIVDGKREADQKLRIDVPTCDICDLPRTVTVPENHWYLVADNRSASSDSRVWGPVPTNAIIGKVEDNN